MSYVIGIDPGKTGGMAAISHAGSVIVTPVFVAGKDLDGPRIADWIWNYVKLGGILCIEKVHSMPQEGSSSSFTFGKGVGVFYGIAAAMLIPLYEVTPQAWKKAVLAGTAKDKRAAIDYCIRRFPYISLMATEQSKKPHDGMADALCIACYAVEKYKDTL